MSMMDMGIYSLAIQSGGEDGRSYDGRRIYVKWNREEREREKDVGRI